MNKKYIKENIFIVTYGLILFFIIYNLKIVLKAIDNLVAITLPVIFGIVLAFLLNIPMSFLERKIILLIQKLKVDKKLDILEKEYDIPMEESIEEEVKTMCNLSEEIEERAMEAGRKEGIEEGRKAGLKEQLKQQVQKKLLKGKDIDVIAEELEEEVAVIEKVIAELEQ